MIYLLPSLYPGPELHTVGKKTYIDLGLFFGLVFADLVPWDSPIWSQPPFGNYISGTFEKASHGNPSLCYIVSSMLSNQFQLIYQIHLLQLMFSVYLSIYHYLPIFLSFYLPSTTWFQSTMEIQVGYKGIFITVPISEMCVISRHDWIHGCQCQVFSSPFVQKWYKVGPKTSYNWSYGAPINGPYKWITGVK